MSTSDRRPGASLPRARGEAACLAMVRAASNACSLSSWRTSPGTPRRRSRWHAASIVPSSGVRRGFRLSGLNSTASCGRASRGPPPPAMRRVSMNADALGLGGQRLALLRRA
eukprot:jgi/Tetstr1/455189/TSEL_042039.t1